MLVKCLNIDGNRVKNMAMTRVVPLNTMFKFSVLLNVVATRLKCLFKLYIIGEITICMLIMKNDNQMDIIDDFMTFIRFLINCKLDLVINYQLDCPNQK